MTVSHRSTCAPAALAAFIAVGACCDLGAQSVRGTVVDLGGIPVPGVVVQLVDTLDSPVARALSNERGEFVVRVMIAGSYHVRTLRIGFRPVLSDVIALAAGEEVTRRIELTGVPVALSTVRVAARSSCGRAAADTSAATFALWEQARTAFSATEITGSSRVIDATAVVYRRVLDATGRHVLAQQSTVFSDSGAQSWTPVPVDSLRRNGYVTEAGDSVAYRAPGLDMMSSDAFVLDHCFRVARAKGGGNIGIAFEPTTDRKEVSEIAGTLWLDSATSELKSIDYRFVNVQREISDAKGGGEVTFARMKNGVWVITKWSLRMPVLAQHRNASRSRFSTAGEVETEVTSFNVTGGDLAVVTAASAMSDTLWTRAPLTLTGTIADSAGAPVVDARLKLEGTNSGGFSDAKGAFTITGVLPGSYTLEVHTASLDSVNAMNALSLTFADSGAPIRIRVPNATQVATGVCGSQLRMLPAQMQGILIGSVSMIGTNAPATKASVMTEWVEGEEQDLRWKDAKVDAVGSFRFCGVPVGKTLVVRAMTDSGSAESTVATVTANHRFARAELAIDPAVPATATLTGVVVTDTMNVKPVVGAEVVVPALSKSLLTNDKGAFRLREIPRGSYDVIVRKIGFGPLTTKMTFTANQTMRRRIVLSPVTVLNQVEITAERMRDPQMRAFEENRKLGLGHFVTRADLAQREMLQLSDFIRELPGVSVATQGGSNAWVGSSRGIQSMTCRTAPLEDITGAPMTPARNGCCMAAVYLDNMRLYGGGETGEVPNINRYKPEQVEAIEYYAGPAQTPSEYSNLNSNCGVVVIHTRRDFRSP